MQESGWTGRPLSSNIENKVGAKVSLEPVDPMIVLLPFLDTSMPNVTLASHHKRTRETPHRTASTLSLSHYPSHSKYWVDCRPCVRDRVDVGIQCSEIAPPVTTATHEVSNARAQSPIAPRAQSAQPADHRPRNPGTVQLSLEQQEVLELVRSGQNVFFTGPAGTFSPFQIIACLPKTDRHGQICAAPGDHKILSRNTGICGRHRTNWYRGPQHRRVDNPLVCWHRSWKGTPGKTCCQDKVFGKVVRALDVYKGPYYRRRSVIGLPSTLLDLDYRVTVSMLDAVLFDKLVSCENIPTVNQILSLHLSGIYCSIRTSYFKTFRRDTSENLVSVTTLLTTYSPPAGYKWRFLPVTASSRAESQSQDACDICI
jgi:hypothetical protein